MHRNKDKSEQKKLYSSPPHTWPPIHATPSVSTTTFYRVAVIVVIFLPAVEVNKYNTVSYLWAASIIAGFFWAGSVWGTITFPSIPANMQSFVLINISSHVCYHSNWLFLIYYLKLIPMSIQTRKLSVYRKDSLPIVTLCSII